MEFVDGASLQEMVARRGPVSPERAANYMKQAAQGLQHAHEAGLVHRDIKPGNLLLDRAGTVKVLDLGLARFFEPGKDNVTERYDEKNAVLGTADYLAPEQARGDAVDIRADIYSLGATLYFLLVGKARFEEGTITQKLLWSQTKPPKPIRELAAGGAGRIGGRCRKDDGEGRQRPLFHAASRHRSVGPVDRDTDPAAGARGNAPPQPGGIVAGNTEPCSDPAVHAIAAVHATGHAPRLSGIGGADHEQTGVKARPEDAGAGQWPAKPPVGPHHSRAGPGSVAADATAKIRARRAEHVSRQSRCAGRRRQHRTVDSWRLPRLGV